MDKWYVIQTKPKRENDLEKRFSSVALEVLNPKIKSLSSGLKGMFPNYIFLKTDLSLPEKYQLVKYTRGVNKILGSVGRPIPISDDVIAVIKERLDENKVLEDTTFLKGTKVKIRKGLLKDLEGVLDKTVSADGRVAVLLKIYEREMKTVLSCKDVSLVA